MSLDYQIVNAVIRVPAESVYTFARRMDTLPQWASGLAAGIQEENGRWFAESPMGRVQVAMAPRNEFGVLDHDVTLPDGTTVHNPLRVIPAPGAAGESSLVSFVVFRLPGVALEDFQRDVAHVERDLQALKTVLEKLHRAA